MHKIVALATMALTIAVAACSPQSNQGVSPNVAKESEQIPESQQEGYMRIIGDLRWDELPNKEAWIKRFPGCFEEKSPRVLNSRYFDDWSVPVSSIPTTCQVNVGGFQVSPGYVLMSDKSAKFSVQIVWFMFVDQAQEVSFGEAIKQKYIETYIDQSQILSDSEANPSAPRYCSSFTCWTLGGRIAAAVPTALTISKLNTIGADSSEL